MESAISFLVRYLEEIGVSVTLPVLAVEDARSLPIFVTQIYGIYRASFLDREYSLMLCRSKERPTPGEVDKHFKLARSAFGPNVAFVFLTLPSFDRKRLIQRRIPFMVPGRQTYLPGIILDLREMAKGGPRTLEKPKGPLSAPSQVLLLHVLESNSDSAEWPLSRWGDVLGYSRSTLTRVHKELAAASLCRPSSSGRRVTLAFLQNGRDLWESSLPHLRSPVRTRVWARIQDPRLTMFEAGATLLARFTMLAAGRAKTYAMSASAFDLACRNRKLARVSYSEDDAIQIERWRYAPGLLSPDGRTVDRLSLYLSLQEERDERIQASLAELLEQIKW